MINLIVLAGVFVLSFSPLFMPLWRGLAASSALFLLAEFLLILRIDAELSNPGFDDSAGAAFTGLLYIVPALIYLSCLTIRLCIYAIKQLKKHPKSQ